MRGLVIFIGILVILASFSLVAANINSEKAETQGKSSIFEFSTFTSAVCKESDGFVHCKDEFFVNCDGQVSKVADAAECNGIKVEAPKALGFAVFDKEWNDPRV